MKKKFSKNKHKTCAKVRKCKQSQTKVKHILKKTWNNCQKSKIGVYHKTILGKIGLFKTIKDFTGLYRTIEEYARLSRNKQDFTGLYRTLQ